MSLIEHIISIDTKQQLKGGKLVAADAIHACRFDTYYIIGSQF
jgi:hypothetical protein